MVFQNAEDLFQLLAGLLQAGRMLQVGDRRRVADARHDVLTLGVHQVVAVKDLLARRSIARERNAGSGGVALVAEDHALHVDGGAQVIGNLILLAVQDGAIVVPGTEHGLHGLAQLHVGVLRELDLAVHDQVGMLVCRDVVGEDLLELRNELLQVIGRQIGVAGNAALGLLGVDGVLEQVTVQAHDHVGEHLDKAAIGVPRKTRVFGLLDEAVDRAVV